MSTLAQAELAMHEGWRPTINPWWIAFTVMLSTFMEVLDTSIANVALPHIAGSLSSGIDESTWVLTSYLVSNAIVLPLTGWFSRLFGRKRFYMSCVLIFIVSSLLCGLAPSLPLLVFFRVLQGAGGGGLQPVSQAILVESFPREKQGMAMAIYGMGVVAAPIIGPTLGGWITDNYSWRWIFFINIPVGLLSIFLTTALIFDPPHVSGKNNGLRTKIDYIGLGLLSVGLGFLQVVLDKGQRDDWFESHFIVWCAVICAVGLIGTVFWELHQKDPVIELHLFKDRNYATATFFMFALGIVLYGTTILLPVMLQTLSGYTAATQRAGAFSRRHRHPGQSADGRAAAGEARSALVGGRGAVDSCRGHVPARKTQSLHQFLDVCVCVDDFARRHGLFCSCPSTLWRFPSCPRNA